METGEKCANLV